MVVGWADRSSGCQCRGSGVAICPRAAGCHAEPIFCRHMHNRARCRGWSPVIQERDSRRGGRDGPWRKLGSWAVGRRQTPVGQGEAWVERSILARLGWGLSGLTRRGPQKSEAGSGRSPQLWCFLATTFWFFFFGRPKCGGWPDSCTTDTENHCVTAMEVGLGLCCKISKATRLHSRCDAHGCRMETG
jgi:hypothetical protein